MLDEPTKLRLTELMLHVVPNPDESLTDAVLAASESFSYEEGEAMKAEFRALVMRLDDYPEARSIVLAGLDDIAGAAEDSGAMKSDTEWLNTCDVVGRRIWKAMRPLLEQ